MKKYLLIGPLALLAGWALLSQLKLIDPFFLPGPLATLAELKKLFFSGTIWPDIFSTLERVLLSFAIAVIIGLPLGLLIGRSEKLYRSVEFIIDFFRSTPATALFPLFLLIFGITDKSKIAAAAFAAMLIIIFNTAYGVMHAQKSRLLAAKIMGASPGQIFRWILFWESLSQTFTGLRSAVSITLVVIIITEMFIGTTSGLGKLIIDSQMTYEIKTMYAAIIIVGTIGYLLNLLFMIAEKKFLHWNGR